MDTCGKNAFGILSLKREDWEGKAGAECTVRAHSGLASLPSVALKQKPF